MDRGFKKMMKSNKAFTLTELLVALGVIAILCAILLPVIFNMMPNQNTIMAKRAYYSVQSVVSDLINDESCYPDKTSVITNPRIGFDDPAGTVNCHLWNETHTETANAATKFKTLFEDKLGVLPASGAATDTFSTSDGMDWAFSAANFTSSGKGGSIMLTVDVNGKNDPNCGFATELGSGNECADKTNGFDRFQMQIYGNGQIDIVNDTNDWAKNAVKVNRNITSEKNSNDED